MARRELLTEEERSALFGVPADRESLARHYTLGPDDLAFIAGRRGEANQLGAAVWTALLRHPGFGYRQESPSQELLTYLADQLGVPAESFDDYGRRAQTRLEHGWEVAAYLGVRAIEAHDVSDALNDAAQAAWRRIRVLRSPGPSSRVCRSDG